MQRNTLRWLFILLEQSASSPTCFKPLAHPPSHPTSSSRSIPQDAQGLGKRNQAPPFSGPFPIWAVIGVMGTGQQA